MRTSPANARQIGGSHYNGTLYQHWDLVADLQLNYYEGQISKYLSRHRQKKGREDVLKAAHFIQKLTELAQRGDVRNPFRRQHPWLFRLWRRGLPFFVRFNLAQESYIDRYEDELVLTGVPMPSENERRALVLCATWQNIPDLFELLRCCELVAESYQ